MRTYDPKRRLKHLALACLVIWLILFVRLLQVQIFLHSSYVNKAIAQQNRRVPVSGIRGTIYDRNGEILAQDIRTSSVCAYPDQVKNKVSTARELSSVLGVPYGRVLAQLKRKVGYVSIASKISAEAEAKLREARLGGVDLIDDTRRIYPLGAAACHVVGLVNPDGEGIEGVEAGMNEVLMGTPGWFILAHDAKGEDFVTAKSVMKEPRAGANVILTIDSHYQTIAASSLKRAVAANNAVGGTIIIVNPATGEILAMANEPSFDPSDNRTWKKGALRNRAVTDQFEPGSTFKLITVSAVLDEKLADSTSAFYAENGVAYIGKARITDTHEHGWLNLKEFFTVSSNIVAAKLGMLLGKERFYRYCRAFGFGATTGIDLPGEAAGKLRNPSAWSERSLPTMAFGQEISVTSLQLVMAYAAIANDGILMRPATIKRVLDTERKPLRTWQPRRTRQVVTASTARTVREFLATAVDIGTGRNAGVDWCRLGGKTGTAQKYDPNTRTYSYWISSFAGLVPAENTKIVCLVVLDQPALAHLGALVAAPVFKEVIETVSKCSRSPLAPGFDSIPFVVKNDASLRVPDVRLLAEEKAGEDLRKAGFRAQLKGIGSRVVSQDPPPGALTKAGAEVQLELKESEKLPESAAVIPDLTGLSVREALRKLSFIAVSAKVDGSGVVVAQFPPPGTTTRRGERCVLTCRPTVDVYTCSTR
ncbi:MAG: penicillin-binding transpeptidase domain-containing protein [Candidatus Eisenbacteria bacterium]|nr:penicillin-binding transpeptidase domain-containing protein [Candidatus Eisenbacteria bacterium]